MSNIPGELKYASSHEWVLDNGDGTVTVGITDHAQNALGDLVFVEVPPEGETVHAGDAFAVVESVKAASDVYAPVGGEIITSNEGLADTPEAVNDDPYGDGWITKIKLDDPSEIDDLMDSEAYAESIED